MDKLFEKLLGMVDYAQEAENNIDIILYLQANLEEIVRLSRDIDLEKLNEEADKCTDNMLGSVLEDLLSVELSEEAKKELIDKIKKRG